jgi:hypothetical protein
MSSFRECGGRISSIRFVSTSASVAVFASDSWPLTVVKVAFDQFLSDFDQLVVFATFHGPGPVRWVHVL